MKNRFALGITLVAAAFAQSTTTTYIGDLNGNATEASKVTSSDHTRTERWQSINGRSIPLEQTQERVISDSGGVKVTERITKKFGPTGEYASTQRVLSEERKTSAGSTVRERVFRSDVNGALREDEQRTIVTQGSGANTTTETTIARPSVNGAMTTTEKRSTVSTGTDAAKKSTEMVYRPSQNGGMVEALRQVTVSTKQGEKSTENTSYYEPGVSGSLELARQSLSTTVKSPDGREVTEVNLYSRAADGRVQEKDAREQVKEQQLIEKRKNSDGSTTESLSVRRPSLADPTRLGSLQQLSETVCKGKCD